MLDFNEFKDEIEDTVNAGDDLFDDSKVEDIAEAVRGLKGFSLQNGDSLDSVDDNVFWDIVRAVDDGRDYGDPEDWRK